MVTNNSEKSRTSTNPEDGGDTFLRNTNNCLQDYMASHHRRFCVFMVPLFAAGAGHKETEGNEITVQLARWGSLHPLVGSEPACSIFKKVAKRVIRDWVCRAPTILAVHTRTKTRQQLSF
jgi:hypothetical protein